MPGKASNGDGDEDVAAVAAEEQPELMLMLKPKPAPELALEAPLQLLDMEREFMLCELCVPRTLLAGLPQFLALGFRLPSEFFSSVWRVACSVLPLLLLCCVCCLCDCLSYPLPLPVASCQLLLLLVAASATAAFCCSAHAVAAATCHLPFATYLMPISVAATTRWRFVRSPNKSYK